MKVVLTDRSFPFPDFEKKELAKHGHLLIDGQSKSPEQTAELVADADAVLTQFAQFTPAVISAMRKCRVIVRYGIGVDNVNLEAARALGIPVSNVPDYCIDEVADHTLALMLALTRGVVNNSTHIKSGVWGLGWPPAMMKTLKGSKVGIIGFGRIGREVARRLLSFKAEILVYDPVVPEDAASALGCKKVTLDELLSQSDIITLHCPSIPETKNILNERTIAATKKNVLLVNVGRGDLVDPNAMVAALRSGQIAAAALDVMSPEPIPPGHPLLSSDRVVLSSHIASVSPEAVLRLASTAVATAIAALEGKLPPNIVNGIKTPRQV